MSACSVNGVKIYYEVSGEGFPLVLIHANPFDRRLWIYQVAHFSTFLKALILVGCSSMPGGRYQERIDGYKKGLEQYHIQHLRALVGQTFSQSRLGRYLLNYFTEWDRNLNAAAIVEIFKALQNRDVTHRLGELKMPVLVMNGEFDNSLPRSRETAQRIRGAVHRVIPGTGHACCLEDPAAFDKVVMEFLRRHSFIK
jgi:3-oxoadipate enol-lactonase